MGNKGAVRALLAENQKAILELQNLLQHITDLELVQLVDTKTQNPDCKSIQTILSHVVSAGYSYNVYIRNYRGINAVRPERKLHNTITGFIEDLKHLLCYTEETFQEIYDDVLEVHDQKKKIHTRWNQYYDIEQLMEHAIVHTLRHRRQIERFLEQIRA